MSKPRPTCVHCGARYGRRSITSETVKWPLGGSPPPYRGNGVVVKETVWREPLAPRARFETRRPTGYGGDHVNVIEASEGQDGVMHRDVWDGESWWGGYEPFCTLRCALDYARKAWRRATR
jgi:hypothetical protein